MAKSKPIKFIIRKGKKGIYCSIVSSNGKNLNPADPQKSKRSVKNTIGSLCTHIAAGNYVVIDETKPKAKTHS